MRIALQRTIVACLAATVCCLATAAAPAASAAGEPAGIREAPVAPGVAQPQAAPLIYAYPPAYDLRSEGKVSSVKDQNPYGTCWAFAALGSLESNLLPGESWDFSEDNLIWYSGFDGAGYNGGNSLMAAAYLARWGGPFTEDQDAYDDGLHPSPSTLTAQKHVQEVIYLPARTSPADNDDIKYALTNWGGVYISMYFSDGATTFDEATSSYYYGGSRAPNHGVLVVGWDDKYSAANFAAGHRPAGDGAFLVKNSWGASFGDGGYFWLSYYDTVAATDDTTAVFRAAEPADDFITVYQRDPLGYVAHILPTRGDQTDWFASRFVATASDDLTAVSFWTLGPNASYEVYAGSLLSSLTSVGSCTHRGWDVDGITTRSGSTPPTSSHRAAVPRRPSSWTVPDTAAPGGRDRAGGPRGPDYSSAATAEPRQSYISDSGQTWLDVVRSRPPTPTPTSA